MINLNSKIFLAGHKGMLGSSILRVLIKKGYKKIITADKKSLDLRNQLSVEKFLLKKKPDVVIIAAAKVGGIKANIDFPANFIKDNLEIQTNVMSVAMNHKIEKLLFFGSTCMYPSNIKKPLEEDMLLSDKPETTSLPYAIAKLGCEYYLKYAGRAYDFPFTILRQTNTYGRIDNDFFVVEQIIIQMLKGNICKLGYRTPYRNFLHIDDLLNLYEEVLKNSDKSKKQIFCTGPNNALRIDELAEKISKKLNWKGELVWGTKPARPGEIYYLNSTNDHVKKILGWEPKIDLDAGLDKTISALKLRENL